MLRAVRSVAVVDEADNCSSNVSAHHSGHSNPGTVLFLFSAFAVGGEHFRRDNILKLLYGCIPFINSTGTACTKENANPLHSATNGCRAHIWGLL